MRIHTLPLFAACLLAASSAHADLSRAQSLFEQGRAGEALAEVEQLLAETPGDAETRFLQGIIYADLGRSQQAIEVFAGLTNDFPELPEPYNNLAVLFAEQGEFEKARDALMAAIQTHPSYSTAHENLGDLYAKMAGIAYDRALEEDRSNESARLKLSAVNGLFSAPRSFDTPTGAPVAQAATPPASAVSEPEPVQVATASRPEPAAPRSEPAPETPTPTQAATRQPATAPVAGPTVAAAAQRPQPAAAPPADEAIEAAIRAWAAAWSQQNVDGYVDAYAPDFRPANGAPRESWVAYRRDRLNAPGFIDVEVGDIEVEMIGSDRARATFVQGYRSDTYQDEVIKTLTMSRTAAGWQIVSEVSEAI